MYTNKAFSTNFKLFSILLCLFLFLTISSFSQTSPRLIIDGRTITSSPGPVIEQGRTLVPIRIISEELGATVSWDEINRTVLIELGDKSALLKIDSLIFEVGKGSNNFDTSDVPAKIISDRTFVPLRLVSNVLGAEIGWDDSSRTVTINSSNKIPYRPYSDLTINISSGKNIQGQTSLALSSKNGFPANAAEVRYYLLDIGTRKGTMIARGQNPGGNYTWLPETERQGDKIVFAALYDSNGNFIKGGSASVNIAINPKITIKNPGNGSVITESPLNFSVDLNFAPKYIKYEMTYQDRDKKTTTSEADPYGPFTWAFMSEDNGLISLKAIAYDNNNQAFESPPINIQLALEKKLSLAGVKNGNSIQNPVTLSANRNFQVSETQYIMRDPLTQKETILFSSGYGSYKWFPKPEESGNKELYVRVKDTRLTPYTSEPIYVTVIGTPKVYLEGIGPNQVLTGSQKLKAGSNVDATDLKVILENPANGSRKTILSGFNLSQELSWTPASEDSGNRIIYVEGKYQGQSLVSEKVNFRVYLGTIYTAKPVIEKSSFQNFASEMALNSAEKTGMSAALQTAQAILETGWGQSVPVDKYTGKFSYNLFGIKGTGPAGSVTSNTWEEYNGTVFRIDAAFRAYSNASQSWDDHKNLLLKAQRYSIFRDVMHSSTQGAWALRRAGYATDSQYPLKLINIVNTYNLNQLDEKSF